MNSKQKKTEGINIERVSLSSYANTAHIRTQVIRTVGLFFAIFIAWASLVPLDEGVPSIATVVIDTRRLPVQHLTGGTIMRVLVREGEMVSKNQSLVQLRNTTQNFDYESARQAYDNFLLQDMNKRSEHKLIEEQLSAVKVLVTEGHLPKIREIELEREYLRLASVISEIQANLIATKERLIVTRESLDKTVIRAPDTGQIVGLLVQSPGSVIQPGQKLMDIVPKDSNLLLEARVAPHLIDRIKIGDVADIRFSSFSRSPQLVVSGKIETLSSDVLYDESPGKGAYYLARVSIDEVGYETLGSRKLQAGMTAEVIFKTGSRTLLIYVVDPLIKRIATTLKEQ
jgi:protease secretion system membrane fusion protein